MVKMQLSHLVVKNYRSIEHLEINVDDYSALVGANGAGKSSILYAVSWLINGGILDDSDVHTCPNHADITGKTISVAATFTDLSPMDRERLEKYGRGNSLTVRRSWTVGDAKQKIVGSALQGPGFIAVRAAGAVADARSAYIALRAEQPDLQESERLASKADLDALLNAWEDDPKHKTDLVSIADDDATNFFGFDGQNRLKQCIRVVLVPAASDIASEVAGTKKGSAVNELIGALMTNAGSTAREAWIKKHEKEIQELTDSMKLGVEKATGVQSSRINDRLQSLIAGATVSFVTDVPSWVPSPAPTVTTDVSLDGIANDVAKQGHGIQRAVMIAMFQSLTPDGQSAEQSHEALEGESEEQGAERLRLAKESLPALIICIEEPEIYQHPIRARSFARVLVDLATSVNVQVMLATHSPYFVRPAEFASLRRFTLKAGETFVDRTTIDEISMDVGGLQKRHQVEKTISQKLPTSFAEGFFADAVVLVEGDTDKSVLEELAQKLDLPLDAAGISVLDMSGKGSLRIPAAMLRQLGIPTYVIADGDSLGSARKYAVGSQEEIDAHISHQNATDDLLAWLPAPTRADFGAIPFTFGDPTLVADTFTIWEDDIENELAKWPSFVTAQSQNRHSLRQKDMLAYRVDVVDASTSDVPPMLRALIHAIHAFRNEN